MDKMPSESKKKKKSEKKRQSFMIEQKLQKEKKVALRLLGISVLVH